MNVAEIPPSNLIWGSATGSKAEHSLKIIHHENANRFDWVTLILTLLIQKTGFY